MVIYIEHLVLRSKDARTSPSVLLQVKVKLSLYLTKYHAMKIYPLLN